MIILGLPLLIEWHKFQPGTSFFVPCLNRREVQRFITQESARHGLDVISKQVVEKGVYGVRAWRKEVILHTHSTSLEV
jgi:hypothetical protein